MRELLYLWLTQKRRSFSWRTFFVGLFLFVYFGGLVVGVYLGVREHLEQSFIPFALATLAPLVATSIIPGDLLIKIFWRHSPVEMDDYLRSRPVAHAVWTRFILFDTVTDFMQWMLPLFMTFVTGLFLPLWTAPVVLLLSFSCTTVNALFQNCWRRAPGNQWTLPLVPAYMVWLVLSYVVAGICFVAIGLADDDPSTTLRPHATAYGTLAFSLFQLLLNVVTGAVLLWYFSRLRNHNEEGGGTSAALSQGVQATPGAAASPSEVTLWSIEWIQIMRSRRLRVSVLTIAVVFLLNTYMQQSETIQKDFNGVNIMLLFGIGFPSIIVAQWVLGIEANFFSAIWTKPWSLQGILRRKYYFFCGLACVMGVLILPCVVFMHMNFFMWLASLLFACGVFILPFMATALFSSRMDMFTSAFFNYQGGNKQLNIFSFVMFVPIGIYYASYFLLPRVYAHLLVGGLGLAGLALHGVYIQWIANKWFNRRYQIMERWLTE